MGNSLQIGVPNDTANVLEEGLALFYTTYSISPRC